MKHEFANDVSHKFLITAGNFAKKSCKDCYGRGYQQYDTGKNTQLCVKHCYCVDKKIKKNLKQG